MDHTHRLSKAFESGLGGIRGSHEGRVLGLDCREEGQMDCFTLFGVGKDR
jgi:hypothetical protein